MHAISSRSYKGANTFGVLSGWNAGGEDQNSINQSSLPVLRNRSRDLFRNDPLGKRSLSALAIHMVGTGIIPHATKGKNNSNKKIAETAEAHWKNWGDKTNCHIAGKLNFYGLQLVAALTIFMSGGVLFRKVRIPSDKKNKLSIGFKIQLLEPDHLDIEKNIDLDKGRKIRQGIEYGKYGQILAYWIFEEHPGSPGVEPKKFVSIRVPSDEMGYAHGIFRPNQRHGVPELHANIDTHKNLDDFSDAELEKKKIASCYAGFIKRPDYDSEISPIEGTEEAEDSSGNKSRVVKVQRGTIGELPPGWDIDFPSPPTSEGFDEFAKTIMRKLSTGVNKSYEAVSGDYSNVNFSSARMGWIESDAATQMWRLLFFIPQFCEPIYQWFRDELTLKGHDASALVEEWAAPARVMLDPVKEWAGNRIAVKSGFKSVTEIVKSHGKDPADFFQELIDERKFFKDNGLTLESVMQELKPKEVSSETKN